jgi:DNA repair exonuclease SbcCD nuclease subunit
MRFVHTSDWQIGKIFRFADEASQTLREERLDAINRLGELARKHDASDILVAGDIYDAETPSERTLRQPIERMRAFQAIRWHLIPGNHDPHTPSGPWQRLCRLHQRDELPSNVTLHLEPRPAPMVGGAAVLLPAVLTRRHVAEDPTAWMDDAETPEGAVRIGLAHGPVASFSNREVITPNLIAADRAERAGLAYLALGDWHGAKRISDKCWYSGTPETDAFDLVDGGTALLVEIDGPRAVPVVAQHRVGRLDWHRLQISLHNATDIDVLETRLRDLSPDLRTVVLWLEVSGALSLQEREAFESRIRHGLRSALLVLRLDDAGLLPQPTEADLAAIDHAGFVRDAANRLATRAADKSDPQSAIARDALQRLYVLSSQTPERSRP